MCSGASPRDFDWGGRIQQGHIQHKGHLDIGGPHCAQGATVHSENFSLGATVHSEKNFILQIHLVFAKKSQFCTNIVLRDYKIVRTNEMELLEQIAAAGLQYIPYLSSFNS